MKLLPKLIIFITTAAFFTGCGQNDQHEGDYTMRRPKLATITGVYRFESETLTENYPDGSPLPPEVKKAKLLLKSDGTFIISNFPDLMANHPILIPMTTGKWKTEQDPNIDPSWPHQKPRWGINLAATLKGFPFINFMGDSPPYKLIINYDDSSLGEWIIFTKE
jgi:hypothetical protein